MAKNEDADKKQKGKEKEQAKDKGKKRPFDLYRDSFVRWFGYAGHIGGAVRPFVPYSVVNVSRALSTTYICSDIISKAANAKPSDNPKKVAVAAGDAMCWQLLASVLIPGLLLTGLNSLRSNLLCRQTYTVKKVSHTVVGLVAIAAMMKPIDKSVDYVMDATYREWTKDIGDDNKAKQDKKEDKKKEDQKKDKKKDKKKEKKDEKKDEKNK